MEIIKLTKSEKSAEIFNKIFGIIIDEMVKSQNIKVKDSFSQMGYLSNFPSREDLLSIWEKEFFLIYIVKESNDDIVGFHFVIETSKIEDLKVPSYFHKCKFRFNFFRFSIIKTRI
jgi:hypothetical protein